MESGIAYAIVGLGNPGPRFDGTRHNVGFHAIDHLATRHSIALKKLKFQAITGDGTIGDTRVLLLKPQTFMNLSGQSVRACLDFYKLTPAKLIVLYDDVALPAGKIRVRAQGSDGGHNGIKDILFHLRTDQFPRVKIGVGAPPSQFPLADWVLSTFSSAEAKLIVPAVTLAGEATERILQQGIADAMNTYNASTKQP